MDGGRGSSMVVGQVRGMRRRQAPDCSRTGATGREHRELGPCDPQRHGTAIGNELQGRRPANSDGQAIGRTDMARLEVVRCVRI
jgi:hypothetical protein